MKRLANGKLWDKYNNLKKYIKKHEKVVEEEDIELSPDHQEALLKLRTIQPNDLNLENLWKETFNARTRRTSIADYYNEYPILKTSIGSKLVILHNILTFCQFIYKYFNLKLLTIIITIVTG